MNKKYIYLGVIVIGIFLILLSIFQIQKIEPYNCNEFGVLYLTPEEIQYASGLADKINGIVYIPETNQMIGRSEIFECEDVSMLDKFMFGNK